MKQDLVYIFFHYYILAFPGQYFHQWLLIARRPSDENREIDKTSISKKIILQNLTLQQVFKTNWH